VKVAPTPKLSSKSKGKQRETAASVKTYSDQTRQKASHIASKPPSAFKLVTGSYEKLLYGLEGSITLGERDADRISVNLKPIFIFPAHVSCVKAVSGSPMGGKWLATGSVDEIVKVWDLRRKKEVGGLMQHQGGFLTTLCVSPRQSSFLSCWVRFYYRTALPLAVSSHFRIRGRNNSYIPCTRLGGTTGFKGPYG